MKEEELSELIVRFLTNEATPEERSRLDGWVKQSDENLNAFNSWLTAWDGPREYDTRFDVQAGLSALNERIEAGEAQARKATKGVFLLKIAASLLLIMATGWVGYFLHTRSGPATAWEEKVNPIGRRSVIQLADGSVVTLNAGSRLRFPEAFGKVREVFLEGEAFFEVTRDSLHPFIVHTGHVATRVLGTSFNVRAFGEEEAIAVTVLTGKVSVREAGEELFLEPSDQAVYRKQARAITKTTANTGEVVAWKDNTLIFRDHTLAEVAGMLERHYGVPHRFQNDAIKRCTFTGKFRNESLAHILRALEFSAGIHFEMHRQEVVLMGAGCQ